MIDVDRFWARITKATCWEWTGALNEKGYGLVGVDGRTPKAHRVAWELTHGPIPDDACVLHRCDNPACCNPDHLFLGSRADNNADMLAKGRHRSRVDTRTPLDQCLYARGEDHHKAKMTVDTVRALRADRERGLSYSELGAKYGIDASAAYKIVARKTWGHVQ